MTNVTSEWVEPLEVIRLS